MHEDSRDQQLPFADRRGDPEVSRPIVTALILALVAPLAAGAQQIGKRPPRIGYLSAGSVSPREAAFRQGLTELGYIEGKNITIEYRFADGRVDRLPGLAAELMRLNVHLIVAASTPATLAAHQVSQTIPIVMTLTGDIVGTGLVTSLARPGGNITRLTTVVGELNVKRPALLKEAFPRLTRVALLRNFANPISAAWVRESEGAARTLGLQLQVLDVTDPADLERAFEMAKRGHADALLELPDLMFTDQRTRLVELAMQYRRPSITQARSAAESGVLMSYGPDISEMHRRAAIYVDKILKGTKPGDLPIEQPTKFELVINRASRES